MAEADVLLINGKYLMVIEVKTVLKVKDYVDESGINSDLKREYGRAPCGVKVEDCKRGRKTKLEEICKAHGVFLLYLPPCSPDLNPIEKTWANMKKELRDTAPLHKLLETAVYAYFS